MNRYPLWKYVIVAVALAVGLLYTLPNFFGEVPAVQISPVRATEKPDAALMKRVEDILKQAGIVLTGDMVDEHGVKVRFADTDTQIKAKDAIQTGLGSDYTVALNLLPASPAWLTSLGALPMYLGLDLRGGVYFLMQVDMPKVIQKAAKTSMNDIRSLLRSKDIRYVGIALQENAVVLHFRDQSTLNAARTAIENNFPDLALTVAADGEALTLTAAMKQTSLTKAQEDAVQQNLTTLRKRVNELGVAEPVIQQQGLGRIVVQLPGVQDTARAKDIIGRTAMLEVRMVDEERMEDPALMAGLVKGEKSVPYGDDLFVDSSNGQPVLVANEVIMDGSHFQKASATLDSNSQPAVSVALDSAGGRIMGQLTRNNIGKKMAIILFDRGKGEAISVATIMGEFSNQFQITGRFSAAETTNLALLIKSGALAAPMEIVEERTVGPSMGADNIAKGFHSNIWGFTAVALFMIFYYRAFGLFSVLALTTNGLILIALLSWLQATLTLPGLAGIALTLGMAIDANVLINERIREELRHGNSPQAAIAAGFDRAFDTILDSNVTTFIAGIALFWLGSGPVRGFAVVLCLGILTSMFSAVMVSRALVNLTYGRKARLTKVAI